MIEKKKKYIKIILIQIIILIIVSLFAFYFGTAKINHKNFFYFIFNKNIPANYLSEYTILFYIRLPRILLAFTIGATLSLSGAILQALFRNPLVDSYTTGIAGGAGVGVCLNILFRFDKIISIITLPISGFLGAMAALIIIYLIAFKKNFFNTNNILLIGVIFSFLSSSIITLLLSISKLQYMNNIIYWLMGSLNETNYFFIYIILITSFIGLVISFIFSNSLNALSLGDEEALNLGINIIRIKKILFTLTAILIGLSVSISGLIGFVGLIIPHFLRLLIGYDYKILLVSCYLSGGAFLIICDLIARTIISPAELPIGVITGIIGGIIFIHLFSKKKINL